MLYSAMGALITIIVGYIASVIINKLQGNPKNNELDANLFTPLVASRIRRRRKREEDYALKWHKRNEGAPGDMEIEKIQSAGKSNIDSWNSDVTSSINHSYGDVGDAE